MKLFGFVPFRIGDIADIILVAILLYEFFKFIRGTKATPILVGLVIFFIISSIARWLDLKTLSWIMDSILTVWVVAFVILFQPEIRNALARIGRQPQFKFFLRVEEPPIIDEIVDAVKKMSEDRIGALILIQKRIGLKDIIDTGVMLNAQINSSLIRTIFFPDTPLHDGAVVIKGDMIVAAGCVLPLSENPSLSGRFGLRHRAALGIAEQSDALCIVVSEETGRISFAYRAKLVTKVEVDLLKKSLEKIIKE
ncbi:TIGR00159 family protein [candidate division WOR-3 bacterium RBG_13_43_14]|uniref:Diadenylate cyclase n=1 Tax=candidate division WOR-3 bacterium RBG_13_43_14 TaxID=1802590 RepID=A0A1F4U9S7_UNCW3|nr:MAG: TIGR00159 family protein [candidate division WOR-3 bacterium RBG_13_43_14]